MYASALTDPDGFGSALAIEVERLEDEHHGRMHAYAELCVPEAGVLRPSMMITWADVLCGSLANVYALPRITMTVDLDVRVVRPVPAGSDVHGIGRVRKSGARLAFTECAFTLADTGELVAFSAGSFMASPREQDQAPPHLRTGGPLVRGIQQPIKPVHEIVGVRVIEPGVVEADRHARLLNPADTVQGGAMALIAEEAVLTLEGATVPTELAVRYLGAVRIGPVRAAARRDGNWVRVELTDEGNDSRLAALAVARLG